MDCSMVWLSFFIQNLAKGISDRFPYQTWQKVYPRCRRGVYGNIVLFYKWLRYKGCFLVRAYLFQSIFVSTSICIYFRLKSQISKQKEIDQVKFSLLGKPCFKIREGT